MIVGKIICIRQICLILLKKTKREAPGIVQELFSKNDYVVQSVVLKPKSLINACLWVLVPYSALKNQQRPSVIMAVFFYRIFL